MDDRDLPKLEKAIAEIWDKARELGLDPFPTHFEIVPPAILYEFGAYLLPGRFSHWTHGKALYLLRETGVSNECLWLVAPHQKRA